ncbi:hypothetical protein [Streptomyces sp. AC154]
MAGAENPRPEAGGLLVKVAVSSVNGIAATTAAGYLNQARDRAEAVFTG